MAADPAAEGDDLVVPVDDSPPDDGDEAGSESPASPPTGKFLDGYVPI